MIAACPPLADTPAHCAYTIFSRRRIVAEAGLADDVRACRIYWCLEMLRYILVFSILFLLGVVACAAATAADAPAFGLVAFAVWLGLFLAALAGGVTLRPAERHK
jgi:hypothetical protein